MTERSFFAGFGGQGILSLGQIWVYCAMKEGKNVTFFPFYGAEKRGGIARASVIASDGEIASPLVTTADSALAMNADSLLLCESIVRKDGLLVVNSNLVQAEPARQDIRVAELPAQDIAEEAGGARFANMVALGALSRLTGALALAEIEAILKDFFPPSKHQFVPINIRAVRAGQNAALKAR
ncbi:MAG: 2-oxoacid:acceptor oxidoreductase family protein [Spirochaetaceae bacterium]|nr:2-oxoacid:acceptor oxidoreductase family protein [Spirochaetaceae bacterium]